MGKIMKLVILSGLEALYLVSNPNTMKRTYELSNILLAVR